MGQAASRTPHYDAAIAETILDEAAFWLMELHEGPLSASRQAQLAHWCVRSPEHARAWQRAALLAEKIAELSPAGIKALKCATAPERRKAVKILAALLVAGPAGWIAYRSAPSHPQVVRYSTGVGRQRDVVLADGSRMTLNTDTEVDVGFDEKERLLILRSGEIMIATAKDPVRQARPFSVEVSQGKVRALGTRFVVRQQGVQSRVAVLEGAVKISPVDNPDAANIVPAGTQSQFSRMQVDTPLRFDPASVAWLDGTLIADKMPMAVFVAELDRYRPGRLRCDPRVAAMPVSGAFPLRDIDLTLALLEQTMPVRLQYITRYWATVLPG